MNEVKARSEKERYKPGVIPYKEMGYWRPEYEPRDTDLLACFRRSFEHGWKF